MPLQNGFQCTKKINNYKKDGKIRKELKLVITTAYSDQNEKAMAKEAGADQYLQKPINV